MASTSHEELNKQPYQSSPRPESSELDEVFELAKPVLNEARQWIKDHPIATVAAGVCLGFLVGRALSSKD